ncbi:MAG: 50S ribosomal protein L10 [Gammaproteobacteria bacterium TMED78]|nr:MAG: 50S ribosomal protein L10 [Gammaproteobacteria bacterium TMED78]|tara:strand:+ start:3979 stop:4500 length:522 start_codon:yes stop_codon:yes gene_type:complete
MALDRQTKEALVAEVSEVASLAQSSVAAEYRGLSVAEMTELRSEARKTGVYIKVIKNTLAKLAVKGTNFECMQETFKGPLLLAFSNEDPGASARVIREFSKDHENLVPVSLSFDGQLLDIADLKRLADLPDLEGARSMLLGILGAPISQFVRILAEPSSKTVRILHSYSQQQS